MVNYTSFAAMLIATALGLTLTSAAPAARAQLDSYDGAPIRPLSSAEFAAVEGSTVKHGRAIDSHSQTLQ